MTVHFIIGFILLDLLKKQSISHALWSTLKESPKKLPFPKLRRYFQSMKLQTQSLKMENALVCRAGISVLKLLKKAAVSITFMKSEI